MRSLYCRVTLQVTCMSLSIRCVCLINHEIKINEISICSFRMRMTVVSNFIPLNHNRYTTSSQLSNKYFAIAVNSVYVLIEKELIT